MTLAPDFAPRSRSALRPVDSDVHASLDLERLRAYRRELEAEEDRVGYWLRLVGAHITVVQAESTTGSRLTVDQLVRVLSNTGFGQSRQALTSTPATDPLPNLPILTEIWEIPVDPDDPEGMEQALARLHEAEEQLLLYARALDDRIGDVTKELILRFRANPSAALSVIPEERS